MKAGKKQFLIKKERDFGEYSIKGGFPNLVSNVSMSSMILSRDT